jgi:hypothetical protein
MKDLFKDFLENEEVGIEREFDGEYYIKYDFRNFDGKIPEDIDFTPSAGEYIKDNIGQLDILTFVWRRGEEGWDVVTF